MIQQLGVNLSGRSAPLHNFWNMSAMKAITIALCVVGLNCVVGLHLVEDVPMSLQTLNPASG